MCVNNVLNLFAISLISVISFWPSLKKVGNCFLGGNLDMIAFMVFHVFLLANIGLIFSKSRLIVHIFCSTYSFLVGY